VVRGQQRDTRLGCLAERIAYDFVNAFSHDCYSINILLLRPVKLERFANDSISPTLTASRSRTRSMAGQYPVRVVDGNALSH
jgi:hypothetical protein